MLYQSSHLQVMLNIQKSGILPCIHCGLFHEGLVQKDATLGIIWNWLARTKYRSRLWHLTFAGNNHYWKTTLQTYYLSHPTRAIQRVIGKIKEEWQKVSFLLDHFGQRMLDIFKTHKSKIFWEAIDFSLSILFLCINKFFVQCFPAEKAYAS